jgi:hypothetical protein
VEAFFVLGLASFVSAVAPFLPHRPFDFLTYGVFGWFGYFGLQVFEFVHDDVAVGVIRAREKGFSEAGAARVDAAVAADGRAAGHVFGQRVALAGDVDDAFAVGVFAAAEEGAKFPEAEAHGTSALGAGLFVVKTVCILGFVEGEGFDRGGVVAVGVVRAAVEVLVAGPDFLELVAALGAVDVGHLFRDDGFFLGLFDEREEVFPEVAHEGFPVFFVLGHFFEEVFHLGGEMDVHDGGEAGFEHLADDFAELGGLEGSTFFEV